MIFEISLSLERFVASVAFDLLEGEVNGPTVVVQVLQQSEPLSANAAFEILDAVMNYFNVL